MKHISEVIKTILPFKLDNIRELMPDELNALKTRVNIWVTAKYAGPINRKRVG